MAKNYLLLRTMNLKKNRYGKKEKIAILLCCHERKEHTKACLDTLFEAGLLRLLFPDKIRFQSSGALHYKTEGQFPPAAQNRGRE